MASKSQASHPSARTSAGTPSGSSPAPPRAANNGVFAFAQNVIGLCMEWFIELLVRFTGKRMKKSGKFVLVSFFAAVGVLLFAQFQNSTRLAYVTGSQDSWSIQNDMLSRSSMQTWCVFATRVETMLNVGHEVATAYSLRRALSALEQHAAVDADKLSACRARIARELAADLQDIAQLIDRDKPHDVWRSLTKLDVRYGGLAAPEIIQLEQRIGSRR